MNIRKKQFICLLVVAFLVIFAKCAYAADGKGVTISCNPTNITVTEDNRTVEFIINVDFPDEIVAGFSGELVYNADDVKIVSVRAANREDIEYWTAGSNGNRISALAGMGEKCPEALKIKATVLNESGVASISIQNIQYAYLDPETYDTEDIDYPSLTVNITQEVPLEVPTETYNDPENQPTPTPTSAEPSQTPSETATDDNGNTGDNGNAGNSGNSGNVNVVDNSSKSTTKTSTDNTKANTKIPQTGANIAIYAIIGSALFGSVVLYKKYSNK